MATKSYYDCVVLDYGMGNLHSAAKALGQVSGKRKIGLSADPEVVMRAGKVVLPGVGAMRGCMDGLRACGLDEAVRAVVKSGRMILAICIGMQLLLEHSEENDGVDCLGLIPGRSCAFPKDKGVKVPHMGWNTVRQKPHPMWKGIEDRSHFYFVHSYCASTDVPAVGLTEHGIQFTAAIGRDNIFATQFHPEKSADVGLRLLKNFMDWDDCHSSN